MVKVQFTIKALEDLAGIWEYTNDTWSEKQADKYYLLLIQACREIINNPKKCKVSEELGTDIFRYLAYRHIILFRRLSTKEILIIRILHGSMDLKNKTQ